MRNCAANSQPHRNITAVSVIEAFRHCDCVYLAVRIGRDYTMHYFAGSTGPGRAKEPFARVSGPEAVVRSLRSSSHPLTTSRPPTPTSSFTNADRKTAATYVHALRAAFGRRGLVRHWPCPGSLAVSLLLRSLRDREKPMNCKHLSYVSGETFGCCIWKDVRRLYRQTDSAKSSVDGPALSVTVDAPFDDV